MREIPGKSADIIGKAVSSGPWDRYCGPPPVPADLLGNWNLDPLLIGIMIPIAAAHFFLLQRGGEWRQRRGTYWATWLLLAILFVSPFCALSSALFSVRVTHHVLLVAIVAPLAVMSLPIRARSLATSSAILAGIALIHICVVWSWHAPSLYALAMSSPAFFWVMQLSLLGTAIAFWDVVLSPRTPLLSSLSGLLTATIQMSLLGAIITFASRPLYLPHFGATAPFGLSELDDQQLAGLIMWVPAVLPYLAAALILLSRRLSPGALIGRAQ